MLLTSILQYEGQTSSSLHQRLRAFKQTTGNLLHLQTHTILHRIPSRDEVSPAFRLQGFSSGST
jgi:hypothetical protein